ncbi:MAG: protein translocase subunit SecD [Planctomycetales bacterium]|nr:protein translocase subunit SecD [Planctomycetales bacterium]
MDGFSFCRDLFWNLAPLAQAAQAAQAETSTGTETTEPSAWVVYGVGALCVLGIFVVPFVLSHFITRAIRMPAHSSRLGIMLAAIFGGLIFAGMNGFQLKQGIDMRGGTNLVYNIKSDALTGEMPNSSSLASALSQRINPSGTKEILIRPLGESQIEIIVPDTDDAAIQRIKDLLQNAGQLEFRIVANSRDHDDIIDLAKKQSGGPVVKSDVVAADDPTHVVGRWYRVGRAEKMVKGVFPLQSSVVNDTIRNAFTGELINFPPTLDTSKDNAVEKWLKENSIREIDMLMAFEYAKRPFVEVTGDDLASASKELNSKTGTPEVAFRLKATSAAKMASLTGGINNPDPDGNFHRRMAIIMDGTIKSAPRLNSAISTQGVIQGDFTQEEVDFLVTILRSGRLPATLESEPASENRVGAGLGATTISKGTTASYWAVAATFACILAYYRFSGIVASVALIINGLLIFGVMIFIGQPLTLPGLAGLVLTVGMSVDANVLIFERIREEKNKGAALRMSIRNGFDRAFTTIIDSNLTTLIAAIVLYWIGTDQVRGFAVALIIGIATSMFTATFCSRLIFEICEKLKLVNLSMSDGVGMLKGMFLGQADVDFMGKQKFCFALSLLLIVTGIAAVGLRGKDILNIDFTGGSGITFQLKEPIKAEDLRSMISSILTVDGKGQPVQSTLVRVEKEPENTVYSLVTSIDDPKLVEKELLAGFAKNNTEVITYRVEYLPKGSSQLRSLNKFMFVSFQEAPEQTSSGQDEPSKPAEATDSVATDNAAADAALPSSRDASASPNSDEDLPQAIPVAPTEKTEFQLKFGGSNDDDPNTPKADKGAKINGTTLLEYIAEAAQKAGVALNVPMVELYPSPVPDGWRIEDVSSHQTWTVVLPLNSQDSGRVVDELKQYMQSQPRWLSLSQIGTRVADEMQQRAIGAILVSLIFIVAYIWFRFQKVSYGLAAVVALVHDVLITLGVLALCHWLASPLSFLLIEDFKIGLTEVAAFLTIIGYSLNDTIVVFDRIREVRGRSPKLTAEMINTSVNQTLSRTLLTSGTTLLTVVLLYVFGGEGIHTFAFALLVGILVGTYSSIFVASPVLLWFSNRELAKQQKQRVASA